MSDGKYWYCLNHHAVEQSGSGCRNKDRLGPYDTEDDAAHALEKVEQRNQEWDNDPRWNDNVLED